MGVQDKDKRVLQLVAAGLGLQDVKRQVGFRDVRQVEAALRRALVEVERSHNAEAARLVEMERLDALYRAAFPRAVKGDEKAIDRCLKISEQRMRLVGEAGDREGRLVSAFDTTVAALDLGDVDGTVVAAGRAVAAQIDYAVTYGTGLEVTKALYLLPHLMNVLRELGATPAAREALRGAADAASAGAGQVSELDAWRARMAGGGA